MNVCLFVVCVSVNSMWMWNKIPRHKNWKWVILWMQWCAMVFHILIEHQKARFTCISTCVWVFLFCTASAHLQYLAWFHKNVSHEHYQSKCDHFNNLYICIVFSFRPLNYANIRLLTYIQNEQNFKGISFFLSPSLSLLDTCHFRIHHYHQK